MTNPRPTPGGGQASWRFPEAGPKPALGTRLAILVGLGLAWTFGLGVAVLHMVGDCAETGGACDAGLNAARQTELAVLVILLALTVVSVTAAILDHSLTYFVLLVGTGAVIVPGLIDGIAESILGAPSPLPEPLRGGLIFIAPGALVLLVAAVIAVQRTRRRAS